MKLRTAAQILLAQPKADIAGVPHGIDVHAFRQRFEYAVLPSVLTILLPLAVLSLTGIEMAKEKQYR